jgi:hypothetical protein
MGVYCISGIFSGIKSLEYALAVDWLTRLKNSNDSLEKYVRWNCDRR